MEKEAYGISNFPSCSEQYTKYPVHRSSAEIDTVLSIPKEERTITEIQAGHMAYRHYIASYNTIEIFMKEHDSREFTDPKRESHSRAYLVKEYAAYEHLRSKGFTAIPDEVRLIDDTLLAMNNLSKHDDWAWQVPLEYKERYINDILLSLEALQTIEPLSNESTEVTASYETFWREGWDAIDDIIADKITNRVSELTKNWHPEQQKTVATLLRSFKDLRHQALVVDRSPVLFFSHNDARQSNIAWHLEKGVCIVDWSWSDVAPKDADVTMFLIDLAKSGHDVTTYAHRLNQDFALTLIGFWLAHSIWQTKDSNTEVREHQVASAAVAFQLLNSI